MVRNSFKYIILMLSLSIILNASWWDNDWKQRVAITINSAVVNQTGKINIDFTALGLNGDLDENSIRIVKENGILLGKQEFTDVLYNNATDTADNAKGEIKFIVEESGTVTYYIYYDSIENGAKTSLSSSYVINGNFEHSSGIIPTAWTIGKSNIGSNAPNNEVHSSEASIISITDVGGTGQTRNVNNSARTGTAFHLHGYRDRQESGSKKEQVWLERTLTVPTTNSGEFSYWFRIQGWDQATSNTSYDRFRVYVNGTIVNPNTLSISNSNISIFSQVYGKKASYSSFGDLGWTKATLNLSAYASTSVTIKIEQISAADNGWKVWQQIDDVEWSLNTLVILGIQESQKPNMSIKKTSCVLDDFINSTSTAKRVPGALIRYAVEVKNDGGESADNVRVNDTLSSEFDETSIINLQVQEGACDCLGVSSASNNGANGTANGITPIILDYGSVVANSSKCGYFEVKVK